MEQKKKSIGTTTYAVTQMDAVKALKVQTKIIKLLGTGAAALLDQTKDIKDKIGDLIPLLMNDLDDELVFNLVISLFEKGVFYEVEGTPKVVDFATHFIGKPMEMWKVVGFILEANFTMGE